MILKHDQVVIIQIHYFKWRHLSVVGGGYSHQNTELLIAD